MRGTVGFQNQNEHTLLFAKAIKSLVRDEDPSDLGALKQFKIRDGESGDLAVGRLRREIKVLSNRKPGFLRLLDSNESERWIVTEYFPGGSLDNQITKFQGRGLPTLTAFRSLVEAVAGLHNEGIVHRDIKPANVFSRQEDLILGDFGIVYTPDDEERITMSQEKVGPRDYMPPWAPINERLEEVKPDFDVYMLGKLLWCMIAGRPKLFREYHHRPANDLEQIFPKNPQMRLVNRILDRCIVEEQAMCLKDATDLLRQVDEIVDLMQLGAQPLDISRPCRVCGRGIYKQEGFDWKASLEIAKYDQNGAHIGSLRVVPFRCDYCTHFEFFAPGYPAEAAKKR